MKVLLIGILPCVILSAETAQKLAESGHCREAMPLLRSALQRSPDPGIRKRLALDGVRCGMSLNDQDAAVDFLRDLNKHFPEDPEVLYLSVHVFSDLSMRASRRLMRSAPASYQVHELNAEALETQGKWTEAEAEYREVLKRDPQAPGIHYRIGRLMLSGPPPADKAPARREFEEELKIDPNNAGAEFVLGELARQDGQDQAAIEHFNRATKLDAGFADAFLGLGRVLLADDRASEAIPPLETAVKLDGGSPMTHYELATAYTRAGRKADAEREFALQKEATQKLQEAEQQVRHGISGAPPQQP